MSAARNACKGRLLHFPVPIPKTDESAVLGRLSPTDQSAVRSSCLDATLMVARELARMHEVLLDAIEEGRGEMNFFRTHRALARDLTAAVCTWLDTTEEIAGIADANPNDAWQQIRELAQSSYRCDAGTA